MTNVFSTGLFAVLHPAHMFLSEPSSPASRSCPRGLPAVPTTAVPLILALHQTGERTA